MSDQQEEYLEKPVFSKGSLIENPTNKISHGRLRFRQFKCNHKLVEITIVTS